MTSSRDFTVLALVFFVLIIISAFVDWDGLAFLAPLWICLATAAILQRLEAGQTIHVHLSADRSDR